MAYVSLCRALYDYAAAAEDELSFAEDALLYVVEADDEEWWKAKLKSGESAQEEQGPIGLVPANYVEEAEPIRVSRALYDYESTNDDELSIREDELLSVFETDGDWLLVKRQTDEGHATGKLGFVPANYVDEVAAVDGVTSPMGGAAADDEVEEQEETRAAPALAAAPALPQSTSMTKVKNDEIKMWGASELDKKKKKKKGTLGIGNSSLFFASESDKAPVQKISILSIVGHSMEAKGKQLNLLIDDEAAALVEAGDDKTIRFVFGKKDEADDVWAKIQDSQSKATAAQEGEEGQEEEEPASYTNGTGALPPPPVQPSQQPVAAQPILPPPTRSAASTVTLPPPQRATAASSPAPSTPAASHKAAAVENDAEEEAAIALYDFEAQGDDELSVAENETLVLVERENDDWWKVRNASGEEGVVPASYVEVTGGAAAATAAADSGGHHATTTNGSAAREAAAASASSASATAAGAAAAKRAQEEEEREEARRREEEEEEEERAERARMQEERRQKQEAQRRAREKEEARREALKAQPAPAPPKAPPTAAATESVAAAKDVSIPKDRSAPSRPKDGGGRSKPSPARTRIWHDKTGQFKVEAEFLGFNQGKIRLHKLNGVVIEVAVEKMSHPDIQYLEDVTGRRLKPSSTPRSAPVAADDPRRAERERERRREKEQEQRRREQAAKGPKRNIDWFEFFLAAQVDVDDCTRYAAAFERDKIDESVLPDMEPSVLRSIGLREGDIIRVMKFIQRKYKPNQQQQQGASSSSSSNDIASQMKSDEALARKLQQQEQEARRSGTSPSPGLFSGPDGNLKNNTRRGRPTPSNSAAARSTSGGIDMASLAAASESLARTSSPISRSATTSPSDVRKDSAASPSTSKASGFDDDAWTPRPPSAKPETPKPATPAPAAVAPAASPAPAAPTPPPPPPPAPAAAPTPPVVEPKPPADPNSALFDKLANMKASSPSPQQRPGASPSNGSVLGGSYSGARGPFAPVPQNQGLLQPLISTQGTGQFLPTSMHPQQTGMMGMQPQQTGFGGAWQQPQATGYGGFAPQQTGFQPQQTGFQPSYQQQQQQPQYQQPQQTGMTNISGFAGQMAHSPSPQPQQQQQQQQQQSGKDDKYGAANIFGQMKQGTLHQDQNKTSQPPQKYDALRPQPTGFQPGGVSYGGGMMQPQQTGFMGGMGMGMQPQQTGFMQQQPQQQPQQQQQGYMGQQFTGMPYGYQQY